MGSNRILRHRRGIHHLNSHFHALYCELTVAARRIRQISSADIHRLDNDDAWSSLTEELIELPAYLSIRSTKIMAALHRAIWDIIEAYEGDEPLYLFEFFSDVIMKYRLDLSTPH